MADKKKQDTSFNFGANAAKKPKFSGKSKSPAKAKTATQQFFAAQNKKGGGS